MPNIAAVLKSEIARVARKEMRQEIEALKKTLNTQRSQLAELKRLVQEQQRAMRSLQQASARSSASAEQPAASAEGARSLRFSAARLKAQRKRLGLSADVFGKLVGASGQSIYLWEAGKTRPSPQNLATIASLRGIGKRELESRLATLGG